MSKLDLERSLGVTQDSPSVRTAHSASSPEIELLIQQRDELHRKHPEIAEFERLRKEVETLERQAHHARNHYDETKTKEKLVGGVKFFTRPKIRSYFRGKQLFRSRGDNEFAATASISLFTDLLFLESSRKLEASQLLTLKLATCYDSSCSFWPVGGYGVIFGISWPCMR
jgi:hypothetical protein